MKKSLVLTFVLVMLVSFGWNGYFNRAFVADAAQADEEYTIKVDFSDIIDISDAGANVFAGANSGHGGHQTRIVHTSHGDYTAYITDSIESNGKTMDEFSIIKINDDGTTKVVFREYKVYDTSQVSLFVDNDENVWAVTVGDNKLKDQFDGRVDTIIAAAYRVDKNTNDATGYNVMVQRKTFNGYGYSSFCYDSVNDKIYTLTCSGDEPGELVWLIFDMKTLTWDGTARAITTKNRQSYPYIYADGKGGMIILNERDIKCTSAGYPEVGNNDGLSAAELAKFDRWSANYLWDQLELYYIPDVYKEEFTSVLVAEADYSRVKGETQEERNSLEFRQTNEYPNFQNNRGGDTFLDADGYLHIIYAKEYQLAAYTRETTERKWIHAVYDISDPNNMKEISSTEIIDDAKLDYWCSFRMYQDERGNLFLISGESNKETASGRIVVYKVNGTPTDGYTYEELSDKQYEGDSVINISNNRSNSLIDGNIGVTLMDKASDYDYIQVSITYEMIPDVTPTPDPDETPGPDKTPGAETPGPSPTQDPGQSSPSDNNVVWYVVGGVVVLAAAAAIVYYVLSKKKKKE